MGLPMGSVLSVEFGGDAYLGGALNVSNHTPRWFAGHLLALPSCFFLSLSPTYEHDHIGNIAPLITTLTHT